MLDRPVLVVALEGWVDAGLGADGAITALLSAEPTELVATFDGESLIDQRARRPVVHISHGVNEGLTWPVIQMRAGTDRAGADVCYLVGPEPDFRWPLVRDLRRRPWRGELGVRLVVGLGAFPAPAPHTRPVRLAATAPPGVRRPRGAGRASSRGDRRALGGLGRTRARASATPASRPSGCGPVSRTTCRAWPSPPPAPPCSTAWPPSATCRSTRPTLHTAADASLQQVDDLIAKSAEHTAMVRQLERSVDAAEGNPLDVGHVADRRRARRRARALPTRRTQRRQPTRRRVSQQSGARGSRRSRRRPCESMSDCYWMARRSTTNTSVSLARDRGRAARRAVAECRRDHDLAPTTDLHARDALREARNHPVERERRRLARATSSSRSPCRWCSWPPRTAPGPCPPS